MGLVGGGSSVRRRVGWRAARALVEEVGLLELGRELLHLAGQLAQLEFSKTLFRF